MTITRCINSPLQVGTNRLKVFLGVYSYIVFITAQYFVFCVYLCMHACMYEIIRIYKCSKYCCEPRG